MADRERVREVLSHPLTVDHIEERLRDGWKPVSIEWERAAAGDGGAVKQELPYGLRVADDCRSLEVDPVEQQIMTAMLELIVDDHPLSQVARELNRRGFRTRSGRDWTQASIFDLLPRLTEAAPDIFATAGWSELRRLRFLRAVS